MVRKDPKTRLQAIGDARVQIEELISGATEEAVDAVATQARPQRRGNSALIVAALSLVIAARWQSRRRCTSVAMYPSRSDTL